MDLSEGVFRVHIDGKWNINDLYVFSRNFEQVYYALYSLYSHDNENIERRIKAAYSLFPWQGGYSAVNFYEQLKNTTPHANRPEIVSMQYASPGWIDLGLVVATAYSVKAVVTSIATSLKAANSTYNEIYTDAQKRKLLRISVDDAIKKKEERDREFERKVKEKEIEHYEYIAEANHALSQLLRLENLSAIQEKTGSPLKTLKILLSLYRRVRKLAEMEKKEKTKL